MPDRSVKTIQDLIFYQYAKIIRVQLKLARRVIYLFPFARLCVMQSISQFEASVAPPLLQAVT